jgi:maleate cis-trans isomerase
MSKKTALLVIPANNTTFEGELAQLCPDVGILAARVKRPARSLTVEDLPDYRVSTLDAIEPFLKQKIDLVIYGCTAAGFLAGPEGNSAMVERFAARTGVETISTASAMITTLAQDGVTNTAVVTPYLAAVNDGLRRYLAAYDIDVEVLSSFEAATTDALGRITQADVLARSRATVTAASKALFIACSQLPTANIVDDLRTELKIPVWSSIVATGWLANQKLSRRSASPTKRVA